MRVVGKLRSFQGKVSITAFGLVPVEDHNEITHHALEVIKSHLYSTRGYPNPMGSQSNMQVSTCFMFCFFFVVCWYERTRVGLGSLFETPSPHKTHVHTHAPGMQNQHIHGAVSSSKSIG